MISLQKTNTTAPNDGVLSNGGFHLPTGKTITIDSGATITNNGTAEGFDNPPSWTTIDASMVNTTGTDGNPAFALVPGNYYSIDQVTNGPFELALPDPTAQTVNAFIYLRDASNSLATAAYTLTNDAGGSGVGSAWYLSAFTDLSTGGATFLAGVGVNQNYGDLVLTIGFDATPVQAWIINDTTESGRVRVPVGSSLTLGTSSAVTTRNSVNGQIPVQPSGTAANKLPIADGSGNVDWAVLSFASFPAIGASLGFIGVNGDSVYAFRTASQSKTILGFSALASTAYGIAARADLTGQTAAASSVTAFTTPNDSTNHSFRVGGYTAITAISAGTLTLQVTFTDENSNAQTLTFFPMGLTASGLTATGFTGFPPAYIRCKFNTAITVKTTFTGVSVAYDVGGTIESLY